LPLKYNPDWMFFPPEDGNYTNKSIEQEAQNDFYKLCLQMSSLGNQKEIIELYKKAFCAPSGSPYYPSSDQSWAESDLWDAMRNSAQNAPTFIAAFYNATEEISIKFQTTKLSDSIINKILNENNIGYFIDKSTLLKKEDVSPLIISTEINHSISSNTENLNVIYESLKRSEELISSGHGREAVQESLWLLETITTAFKGEETQNGKIEGKYFNNIVKDLKNAGLGSALSNVLNWITNLHGFLSSPTGGGIRHGLDLKEGFTPNVEEARLYFNLIRSYTYYLIHEHKKLKSNQL